MKNANYDIIHKLRGPLATMKWTMDLFLQDDDLTDKQKDRLNDLYSTNEKLIGITGELLLSGRREKPEICSSKEKTDAKKN